MSASPRSEKGGKGGVNEDEITACCEQLSAVLTRSGDGDDPLSLLPSLSAFVHSLSLLVNAYVSDVLAVHTLSSFPPRWREFFEVLGTTEESATLAKVVADGGYAMNGGGGEDSSSLPLFDCTPPCWKHILSTLSLLHTAIPRTLSPACVAGQKQRGKEAEVKMEEGGESGRKRCESQAQTSSAPLTSALLVAHTASPSPAAMGCTLPDRGDMSVLSVLRHRLSPKKAEEVERLASLIVSKMRESSADVVVEIGAGKGYLSQMLAFRHGIRCVALEGSESIAKSSMERARRIRAQCLHAVVKAYHLHVEEDEGSRAYSSSSSSSDSNDSDGEEESGRGQGKRSKPTNRKQRQEERRSAFFSDFVGQYGEEKGKKQAEKLLSCARIEKEKRKKPAARVAVSLTASTTTIASKDSKKEMEGDNQVGALSSPHDEWGNLWEPALPSPLSLPFFIDSSESTEENAARLELELRKQLNAARQDLDGEGRKGERGIFVHPLRALFVGLHTCGDLATTTLKWCAEYSQQRREDQAEWKWTKQRAQEIQEAECEDEVDEKCRAPIECHTRGEDSAGEKVDECPSGREKKHVLPVQAGKSSTSPLIHPVGVINVGCCYHKDTVKIIYGKDGSERKKGVLNYLAGCEFPLCTQREGEGRKEMGRKEEDEKRAHMQCEKIASVAKELACHDMEKWIEKHLPETLGAPQPYSLSVLAKHSYRAMFEVLVEKREARKRGEHLPAADVGGHDMTEGERWNEKEGEKEGSAEFGAFVSKTCTRLSIPPFDVTEVEEVWSGHAKLTTFRVLFGFYISRLLVAPAVEALILLDRQAYCLEKGFSSCQLLPIFDPTDSPRNIAVIAMSVRRKLPDVGEDGEI